MAIPPFSIPNYTEGENRPAPEGLDFDFPRRGKFRYRNTELPGIAQWASQDDKTKQGNTEPKFREEAHFWWGGDEGGNRQTTRPRIQSFPWRRRRHYRLTLNRIGQTPAASRLVATRPL